MPHISYLIALNCPQGKRSRCKNVINRRLQYTEKYFQLATIIFGNAEQVLDMSSWEWIEVEPTGELPEPRSGHQVRDSEVNVIAEAGGDPSLIKLLWRAGAMGIQVW